jgi:uncharacterized membrane protein
LPASRHPDEHARAVDGRHWLRPPGLDAKVPHHPAVVRHAEKSAEDIQLRLADKITAVAGSMPFVYFHIAFFALWMLVFENSPWPTLTLTVSLEAIFLSTFVLISQNRQAAFQQAKADHDYQTVNKLLEENTAITRAIHQLAEDARHRLLDDAGTTERPDDLGPPSPSPAASPQHRQEQA